MGTLYIVATPIGNLEDITLRALRILKEVDLIACEDTRHTKILLDRYQIKKPTISYHQHTKLTKLDYLIKLLAEGKNIALVTDAGTPGISDPAGMLVSRVEEFNKALVTNRQSPIAISPIPGSSALTAALSVCGFPTDKVLFLGFLPKKKGRQSLLNKLNNLITKELKNFTIVLYESPYRLLKTLNDLRTTFGDCQIVVCRELTKKFEEIKRGKISEMIEYYSKKEPKGEFTIIVQNAKL